MDRTAHGGDLYGRRAALDFSSNISPLGLPETVGHALVASMEAWDNYPDSFCRDLTAALAQHEAVPKDWDSFWKWRCRFDFSICSGASAAPRTDACANLFRI